MIDRETLETELPARMLEAVRWILWKLITNGGDKPKKVPFYADGTIRKGKLDSQEDITKLATFDVAMAAFEANPTRWAGIGFALGKDGPGHWQGVDLDHLEEHPDLTAMFELAPGYIERSPSGTGVHILGYGKPFTSLASNPTGIEAYSAGRFFTVTGDAIGGGIADLSDFVDILEPLHRLKEAPQAPGVGSARTITGQGRNSTLASLAGTMRHRGMSEASIRAALLAENAERFSPPLSDAEVSGIAASYGRYPPGQSAPPNNPSPAPPGNPPPINLLEDPEPPRLDLGASLPPVLEDFAYACAAASGLEPGGYAYAAVAAASGVIRHGVKVELSRTWLEPILLWTGLVGPSGSGKSPCMDAAIEPIVNIHMEAAKSHENDMIAWEATGKKGDRPRQDYYYSSNPTIEALTERLAHCDHHALRHADEGTGWINAMGRYANNAGDGERADWLKAFHGKPHTITRISREDRSIEAWGVSVLYGITPSKLKGGYEDAASDGMLARTLIYLMSEENRIPKQQNFDASKCALDYASVVNRLAHQPNAILQISNSAAEQWSERQAFCSEGMRLFGEISPGLASFLGKLVVIQARLAGLFHLLDPEGTRIGPVAMGRAREFCQHAMAMARVAHMHTFERDGVTEIARKAALKILSLGKDRVARRDFITGGAFRGVPQAMQNLAITHLFHAGWLLKPDSQRGGTGHRFEEATAWTVNPDVHVHFAEAAKRQLEESARARAMLVEMGSATPYVVKRTKNEGGVPTHFQKEEEKIYTSHTRATYPTLGGEEDDFKGLRARATYPTQQPDIAPGPENPLEGIDEYYLTTKPETPTVEDML